MEGLPANTNVVGILVLLAGLAAATWWTTRMRTAFAGCSPVVVGACLRAGRSRADLWFLAAELVLTAYLVARLLPASRVPVERS